MHDERANEIDLQTRRAILLTAATLPLSLPLYSQHLPHGVASAAEAESRSVTDGNAALEEGPNAEFPNKAYPDSLRDNFTTSDKLLRTEVHMSPVAPVDLGGSPEAPDGTSVPASGADPADTADGPLVTREYFFMCP